MDVIPFPSNAGATSTTSYATMSSSFKPRISSNASQVENPTFQNCFIFLNPQNKQDSQQQKKVVLIQKDHIAAALHSLIDRVPP